MKSNHDLSIDEIKQVYEIAKSTGLNLSYDYIAESLRESPEGDFIIARVDNRIKACVLYRHVRDITPFYNHPIDVAYAGITFKDPEYPGNVMNDMGKWWIKKRYGVFRYLFSPCLGLAITVSPRVYDGVKKKFPLIFPTADQPVSESLHQFLLEHLTRFHGFSYSFPKSLVIQHPRFPKEDITSVYENRFKSRNEQTNQFFQDRGIIEKRGSKYFLTGKVMVVGGLRSLSGRILNKWPNLG